jgi:hypothetical protein
MYIALVDGFENDPWIHVSTNIKSNQGKIITYEFI